MVESVDVKRRRLLGAVGVSGLVLVSSAALAQMSVAPKKAATTDDETIPATEDLMREHGVAERVLLIYQAGVRRIGQGEDIEREIFSQAA